MGENRTRKSLVAIDGASWPIVMPSGMKGMFDIMVDAVVKASKARMQNLEVDVRCKHAGPWGLGLGLGLGLPVR